MFANSNCGGSGEGRLLVTVLEQALRRRLLDHGEQVRLINKLVITITKPG